jgi:L,D-transpeptidase YbiS
MAVSTIWAALLTLVAADVSVVNKEPALAPEDAAFLEEQGWAERVGGGLGIWVSVDEQRFRLVEDGKVVWSVPCSTAANGTGSQMGSEKTPLGWHVVSRKIGDGAPVGQVFRGRAPTKEIWKPGDEVSEDLVLTRILILDGLEPGKNKGGNVDSRARYIYVHGTNDEERIGEPASHGCVRLRNADVVTAFERIPEGTALLITERE